MDIPNQNSDNKQLHVSSDKVRGFTANPAALKSGVSGVGSAVSGVAAARFPGAAKIAKGAADQHYRRTGGLSSQVEAPHTLAHSLENYSNTPFYIWAGAAAGGLGLNAVSKVPLVGSPFKHGAEIANAASGAMNTKLGSIHRVPETFFNHWLYGKPEERLNYSASEALEKRLGLYGREGTNGRLLRWVSDMRDKSAGMSNRFSEKFAALPESEGVGKAVFGEAGLLSKAAGAFGAITNPLTSVFARGAKQNVHGNMGKARGLAGNVVANLAHLDKRADILERQADKAELLGKIKEEAAQIKEILFARPDLGAPTHYFDEAKNAFSLGEKGGVHQLQERLEKIRPMLAELRGTTYIDTAEKAAPNAMALPNPKNVMESVQRTATGAWEKGKNLFVGSEQRAVNKAIGGIERDLHQMEKSLGKSIASHGRAEILSDMKQLPGKFGQWAGNMSLHEASFLGMLGFGAVAKVQDHAFHRKHRGQMVDQLRSDMAEAGIDPYNSSIAQVVKSASSKKGWVDVATTTGHIAMDGVFLGMMGGHGSEAAKAAEKAIPKMPKVAGLGKYMLPAAIGLQMATMMGGNSLKSSIAPVLESYTDMKAMETAGEQPPVEMYAQLLSAFSPKLAEYGMNSRLVTALAEQYAAEGMTAIQVVKEVDRQMPLDQRVAKVEQEFVKKDVDVAHKAKASASAPAAIEGGEHVDVAEKVNPEVSEKESFVARLEAERGGQPMIKKPLVNASATPPAALHEAPPAKLELADAALEGVVAEQQRQVAAQ